MRARELRALSDDLDSAIAEIEPQRSPEVEIALQVTRGLLLELEQLEVHCGDLGTACEDYATQVESVRDTVAGILRDLAIEVGITAVASGVLSFFTFGGAAAGGTAIAGWRLASAARKVIHAFTAMKAVTAEAAKATAIALQSSLAAAGVPSTSIAS